MTALDELQAAAEDAGIELARCRREWNALCRKHGGAKKTIALAWGSDEELAKSIRAVRWPFLAAEGAFRKAKRRLHAAALYSVASQTLDLIKEQEVAHV